MNYLAHGCRFLDRPWFLAGTAVPDWLSVADRRVRMRPRFVEPRVTDDGTPAAEIAAGVARHLADDDWFHATPAMFEVTAKLGGMLRDTIGTDGFRCGFLGHVLTEMLLDAVLARRVPKLLPRYYAALDAIDARVVQAAVNAMSPRADTDRLVPFVDGFRRVRFLEDYLDPARLLYRLNQVVARVRLPPLPDEVARVVDSGEAVVAAALPRLLPVERFGTINALRRSIEATQ
jgi:hypothetical protein